MFIARRTRLVIALSALVAVLAACSSEIGDLLDPSEAQSSVTVRVEGPGAISIAGEDTDCTDSCQVEVAAGTQLELEAVPEAGAEFSGWSGACSGDGSCVLDVDSDMNVEASFAPIDSAAAGDDGEDGSSGDDGTAGDDTTGDDAQGDSGDSGSGDDGTGAEGPGEDGHYVLAIDTVGTGSGVVVVPADEFVCQYLCEMQKNPGDIVEMEAVPEEGSFFVRWTGACEPEGTEPLCDVTMDKDEQVSAEFRPEDRPLTLEIDPVPVGGTISGAGIDCGDDSAECASAHSSGDTVELQASASPHFEFVGWAGGCADSTGPTCSLTVDGDERVSASFDASEELFELTIEVDGSGGGSIIFPDGEVCDIYETCDQRFPVGEEVTMTAAPDSGSYISKWDYEGCDDFAGTCTIRMDRDIRIEPFLHVKDLEFILRVEPPVGGTITSGDITCGDSGDDCRADYQREDTSQLQAVPSEGYDFAAWGGDCSSNTTPVCNLEFFDHKDVSASFRPE